MEFTDIRLPDGRKIDGEDFVSVLIGFEIPTNFGNLHDFVGSRPVGTSGLLYDFDHIEIIKDTDIAYQNPTSIDDCVYFALSEMKVIKHCPRPSIMILENGILAVPSSILYPDWLGFGKLVSMLGVPQHMSGLKNTRFSNSHF